MKLPLLNIDGSKTTSIEISDKLVNLKVNYKLIKIKTLYKIFDKMHYQLN